jgi:RimJ/RimL family protein N-acetyltransferase
LTRGDKVVLRKEPLVQGAEVKRITLEPQVAAHAAEMFAVLQDPRIYEYEHDPPRSEEWLRERYTKLETRRSRDGSEHWLNWVVRLDSGAAIGYVQATVEPDGRAFIAYVLASRWWGQGLAQEAVQTMMQELRDAYRAKQFVAVFKKRNERSRRLLARLGFVPVTLPEIDADEDAMERLE